MKKTIVVLLLLVACKKSSSPPATLTISISDNQGNPISFYLNVHPDQIHAYLYTSLANFGNPGAAYQQTILNSNDNAVFPGIPARQYYFFIQGTCGSNSGSDSATFGPIVAGTTNGVSTIYNVKAGCTP